eukprot:8406886-Pyramimonas_sp.AAC.1
MSEQDSQSAYTHPLWNGACTGQLAAGHPTKTRALRATHREAREDDNCGRLHRPGPRHLPPPPPPTTHGWRKQTECENDLAGQTSQRQHSKRSGGREASR